MGVMDSVLLLKLAPMVAVLAMVMPFTPVVVVPPAIKLMPE